MDSLLYMNPFKISKHLFFSRHNTSSFREVEMDLLTFRNLNSSLWHITRIDNGKNSSYLLIDISKNT